MRLDSDEGKDEALAKLGFKPEEMEIRKDQKVKTGYPKPERRFRLDLESDTTNVEQIYYWIVGHARDDFAMPYVEKIIDTHAASAASSMFGDIQGRISAQQGQVSNYMGMMGKLLKDLFALVRELRQLKERLDYYSDSFEKKEHAQKTAEATLKDVWITLVEGGTQNPGSVYGMASRVQFTTLPDLFFASPVFKEANEIDPWIKTLDFNTSVKSAVRRKLHQFFTWKKHTYTELTNKKKFQIRYLRQHFEVIRMYMQWIKPYLKNLKRLEQNQDNMDDPMVINSFESSISEIEVLLAKNPIGEGPTKVYPVVLQSYMHRTKPSLDFHMKDAYHQKGPVHVGRTEITLRAYAWTKTEIDNYKKYRDQETMDMILHFDKSVSEAMDYLGEDLKSFLLEAETDIPDGMFDNLQKKETVAPKQDSVWDLVAGPGRAIGELFAPLAGSGKPETKSNFFLNLVTGSRNKQYSSDSAALGDARKQAGDASKFIVWQCFKNYKKAHRIIAW